MLIWLFQNVPVAVVMSWLFIVSFLLPLLALVWSVGRVASRAISPVPFCQCWGAWFCFFVSSNLWPSVWVVPQRYTGGYYGHRPWFYSHQFVVVFSVAVGAGLMLAIASMRRGDWLTRLFALPVLALLLIELYAQSTNVNVNFNEFVAYWVTGDPDY